MESDTEYSTSSASRLARDAVGGSGGSSRGPLSPLSADPRLRRAFGNARSSADFGDLSGSSYSAVSSVGRPGRTGTPMSGADADTPRSDATDFHSADGGGDTVDRFLSVLDAFKDTNDTNNTTMKTVYFNDDSVMSGGGGGGEYFRNRAGATPAPGKNKIPIRVLSPIDTQGPTGGGGGGGSHVMGGNLSAARAAFEREKGRRKEPTITAYSLSDSEE